MSDVLGGELAAVATHARRALDAAAGVVDSVRERAEQRMGVDAADPAVLDDPTYDAALSWCVRLERLVAEAEALGAEAPS